MCPAQWFLSAVIEVMEHIDTSAVSPNWTLGTFSILVSSISQKCSVLRGPEVAAAAAQLRVMSLPWTNQRSVLWLC